LKKNVAKHQIEGVNIEQARINTTQARVNAEQAKVNAKTANANAVQARVIAKESEAHAEKSKSTEVEAFANVEQAVINEDKTVAFEIFRLKKIANFVGFCYVNSYSVYVFDPVTLQQLQCIKHNAPHINIDSSTSIMTKDSKIFVTGSTTDRKHTHEFNIPEQKMEQKANMITGRYRHAIVGFRNNYIIAAGGHGNLSQCEAYSIKDNQWKQIAALNIGRNFHTLFQSYDKYAFVYGGHNGAYLTSFERIELDENLNGQWQLIEIQNLPQQSPTYQICSIEINQEEVLIFGRCTSQGSQTLELSVFNCLQQQTSAYPYKLIQNPTNMYGCAMVMSFGGKHIAISREGNSSRFDGANWVYKAGEFAS